MSSSQILSDEITISKVLGTLDTVMPFGDIFDNVGNSTPEYIYLLFISRGIKNIRLSLQSIIIQKSSQVKAKPELAKVQRGIIKALKILEGKYVSWNERYTIIQMKFRNRDIITVDSDEPEIVEETVEESSVFEEVLGLAKTAVSISTITESKLPIIELNQKSKFRIFKSISKYGASYTNLAVMTSKQFTYALHSSYPEVLKQLNTVITKLKPLSIPGKIYGLKTLEKAVIFLDKALDDSIKLLRVNSLADLIKALDSQPFKLLFSILFTPPDTDISDNYETLETYGDATLDRLLYRILIQISNRMTSSTMHEHRKLFVAEIKKLYNPNILHQYKKAIVSKFPLSETFKIFGFEKLIPQDVKNPNISYQEDVVEALFGALDLSLRSVVGSEFAELYTLSLLRKIIPNKLIHMTSLLPGNIRNLVVKGILNDREPIPIRSGNVVEVYVNQVDLKKFVKRLHGEGSNYLTNVTKLKSRPFNIEQTSKNESGEIVKKFVSSIYSQIFKYDTTQFENGDIIDKSRSSKALIDQGYVYLYNSLTYKFKFNYLDIMKFRFTKYIDADKLYEKLLSVYDCSFIDIVTRTVEKIAYSVYKNIKPWGEDAPLGMDKITYSEGSQLYTDNLAKLKKYKGPNEGQVKRMISNLQKELDQSLRYETLGRLVIVKMILDKYTELRPGGIVVATITQEEEEGLADVFGREEEETVPLEDLPDDFGDEQFDF